MQTHTLLLLRTTPGISPLLLLSLCLLWISSPLPSAAAEPTHIITNFQTFSQELLALAADSEEASETRPGVNLYNPFGIGYLLSNINEQLWNVSNSRIAGALRTLPKYVSDDYGYLLGQFKKNKFKITSTVYSRYGNVTKSPGISKLLTHLITLDFGTKPVEFVDSFSSLLDLSTRGHLENELIPRALWQQVFENSTQGAYINTMYFKTKLAQPWVDIGERSFNYDAIVKFLEVEGEFPVLQNDNLTAVIVKIQETPSREIIFIKPHSYIPFIRLRQQINTILNSNESWPLRKLRVQVPALNITNLARHNLGMSLMGVNETFCRYNASVELGEEERPFVQQPITQASHFEFAPGYIEFASATASLVTTNVDPSHETSELDEYDDDYSQPPAGVHLLHEHEEEAEEDDNDTFPIPSLKSSSSPSAKIGRSIDRSAYQKAMDKVLKSGNEKCENPEDFAASHTLSQTRIHNAPKTGRSESTSKGKGKVDSEQYKTATTTTTTSTTESSATSSTASSTTIANGGIETTSVEPTPTLIFDTPFTWIIRDGKLGEAVSGSVSSLCQYNKVMTAIRSSPAHAWLQDVFKLAFWKCV